MTAVETAPTQAEMGLSSITTLLTQISNEIGSAKDVFSAVITNTKKIDQSWQKRYLGRENKSFSVIENIRNTTTDIFDLMTNMFAFTPKIEPIIIKAPDNTDASDSVVNALGGTSKLSIYDMLSSINDNTISLNKSLVEQIEESEEVNPIKKEKPKKGKITVESFYIGVLDGIKTIIENTKQKSQVNFLSGNFGAKEKAKEPEKPRFDLRGFAESVKTLESALKPKFMKTLETFKSSLEKVLSFDSEKFKPFIDNFSKFSESVSEFAIELKPLSKTLFMLSGALFVFGIAGANPLIYLGIAAVGVMGKTFTKYFKDGKLPENILQFSYAIGILSAAMVVMNFVNFGSVIMMVSFIAMLGYALRTYRKSEIPALLHFSYAIGILTVAMVAMNFVTWGSVFMMIGFIWGLGKVLNGKTFGLGAGIGVELMKFGVGMGILTLSLFAFSEIPIESPLLMLGFIGGLLMILKVMNHGKTPQTTPIASFALGVGILVLAMFAIEELPWTAMAKMLIFIVGVALAVRLGGGKGQFSGFAGFAFGMGLLVLAAYAIGDLEWSSMFKFIVFLSGVALSVRLMGDGAKSKMSMLAIAGGIIGIAAGMFVWTKAGAEWADVFMLLTTITGLGIAAAVLGAIGTPALIGAGIMVALGATTMIFAIALNMISKLDIDWGKIGEFALGCLSLATTMALLLPIAVIGAVGAVLMIPIGVSATIIAASMMLISNLKITPENIDNFNYAVSEIALGFAKNTLSIGLGVIGAALFLPIATVSLLSAGLLALISMTTITPKKIEDYNTGMKMMVDAINEYGIIELGKAGTKALLIMPLMVIGKEMSEIMMNLGNIKVGPKEMSQFTSTLSTYVDEMAKVINNSVSKIEDCKPGLEAISKLTGIAYTLAKTVQSMANMEIVEHEVKNGQLVVKDVHKFNFNNGSLALIAGNIGKMISAMTEPLVALASNSDELVVGGVKIKNPFSKKNRKGIEFVKLVAETYKPIVESITSFSQLEMSKDPAKFEVFKTSMLGTVDVLALTFAKLATMNPNGSAGAIKSIQSFIGVFNSSNIDSLSKFNNEINISLSSLADDTKWNKITKNLDNIRAKFYDIATAIKSIDIEKATAFENNLKLLVDKNNAADLAQSVTSLAELLGLVQEHQQKIQTEFADRMGVPESTNTVDSTKPKTEAEKKKDASKSADERLTELIADLMEVMSEIKSGINGTNTKLGGVLKVSTVNGNSNKI